jgi:hypothetical protein
MKWIAWMQSMDRKGCFLFLKRKPRKRAQTTLNHHHHHQEHHPRLSLAHPLPHLKQLLLDYMLPEQVQQALEVLELLPLHLVFLLGWPRKRMRWHVHPHPHPHQGVRSSSAGLLLLLCSLLDVVELVQLRVLNNLNHNLSSHL